MSFVAKQKDYFTQDKVSSSVTHLSDVKGCEADCEDNQHGGQQVHSPSSPLPEETQDRYHCSIMLAEGHQYIVCVSVLHSSKLLCGVFFYQELV